MVATEAMLWLVSQGTVTHVAGVTGDSGDTGESGLRPMWLVSLGTVTHQAALWLVSLGTVTHLSQSTSSLCCHVGDEHCSRGIAHHCDTTPLSVARIEPP